MNLACVSTDK